MNLTSLGIGAESIVFGLTTLVLRAKRPRTFGKLEAMKAQWGEKPGTILHVIADSVVPILFGATCVFAGVRGIAVF